MVYSCDWHLADCLAELCIRDSAISALGGAERRLVRRTGAQNYYMGYDDNSLGVKPINPLVMSPINGTEALLG